MMIMQDSLGLIQNTQILTDDTVKTQRHKTPQA